MHSIWQEQIEFPVYPILKRDKKTDILYVGATLEHAVEAHFRKEDGNAVMIIEEKSIGDYVLTVGEIAAMAVVDSVTRLVPGVINEESLKSESFTDNLLDYPVYTKPSIYRGMAVPEVLLSGDHKKIEEYRYNERIRVTKEKRPDLMK